MDDSEVLNAINRLADEEKDLYRREASKGATDADRERRRELEVMLDQCWDLLRQRRAKRHAGEDPDDAKVRDPNTVEKYLN
jgi:hypothetical protein